MLVIGGEVSLRLAGALDFPLFSPGPPYGYIPRPNQSGAFMRRNDWVFNERSMGVARPFAESSELTDTLLIGDSIVSGGNPYKQVDRLGPQLEQRVSGHVWPVSANSWAMANELTYIRENPDIARGVDRIIFITNSEDFTAPSVWRSGITHPTRPPLSALAFVIQKKLVKPPPVQPVAYPVKRDWDAFARQNTKPLVIVAYPKKAEALDPALRQSRLIAPLRQVLGANVKVIDIGADPRWTSAHYRDDIHPQPESTKLLADIISEGLR